MWFKNLRIYKLTEPIALDDVAFEKALFDMQFQPCGKLDPMRYGFDKVVGEMFAHKVLGCTIFRTKRQDKLLPPVVIAQELEEKVRAIIAAENRSVGRKERQSMKDEVILSMLPSALKIDSFDYAYIDHKNGWIIVNTPSARRAEDLCSKLREALGSLRAIPLQARNITSQVMTHWLQTGKTANNFELGESVEMQAGKDGRIIRARKQDLTANEILAHINSGMFVSKVALTWRESINFTIDETFAVKNLSLDDVIKEKSNDRNPESKQEQFDADFAVMTVQLEGFIKDLLAAFGGEVCVI